MSRLIASILVALAMFLSPLAMGTGGAMAMAHPGMSQVDDGCAATHPASSDDQKPDMKMSCAIACAALPATHPPVGEQTVPQEAKAVMAAAQVLIGIWPEGETPPPRLAPEI